MTERNKIWVAEYSDLQKCFHVEELTRSVELNAFMICDGIVNDWVPVFAGTQRDCHRACEELRQRFESKTDSTIGMEV